jgi:hypothetical protein
MSALEKFLQTPELPSLGFRSLKGHPTAFIINAKRGDRIILLKRAPGLFSVADCGPHDNVYRHWDRSR